MIGGNTISLRYPTDARFGVEEYSDERDTGLPVEAISVLRGVYAAFSA